MVNENTVFNCKKYIYNKKINMLISPLNKNQWEHIEY